MLDMQSTSPIRRYVLLRQRGHGDTSSRWSMQQIAPTPRGAARAPVAVQLVRPAGQRGC